VAKSLIHGVEGDAVPPGISVRPKTSMKARALGIFSAGVRTVRQQGGKANTDNNQYYTKDGIS